MNRVVMILDLVVIAACVIPDLSRAHRHVLALPEDEGQSLTPTGPAEFIGSVLKGESLSQRAEQPSWNSFNLPMPMEITFQASSGIILLLTEASMDRTV